MRRRGLIALGVLALVVVIGGIYLASRSTDSAPGSESGATGLEEQRVEAGDIEVTIRPMRVDEDGAVFKITLDTHSVELDGDLTRATLEVAGTVWPAAEWRGDGPGGHHREGELSFDAAGQASGVVILRLDALPEPVEARWELPG